ncbi:MAG: MFS transporter [bacterium]
MPKLLEIALIQPLQARNFRLLWISQMVAWTGDSIYQIGLLWLILEMTGSQSLAGIIAAMGYLPALILGLFLGALVDVYDRRKLMIFADGLRVLVILYIPIAFTGGWLSPWQLALAAFFIASGNALFNPARDASVPHLAPPGSLLAANTLIQSSAHLSMLIGPLFAAGILAVTSLMGLFYFDAIAYFISLVTIFMLALPKSATKQAALPPLKAIGEALHYSVKEKWSGLMLLLTSLDNLFIMGPALVGIPILVREELKLGVQEFAVIQACFAVGMLIGAFLIGTFGKSLPKGKVLLFAILFDGITFMPVYFAPDLYWLGAIIIFHSIGIPFIMVPRISLIQEGIPPALQGRFFALANLTVVGMTALSAAMTGVACEVLGARTLFLIIGMGGGVCGLLGFLLKPLRERC